MKNTFLLPLTLCLSVNGLASEVFNTTPDWSCTVPVSLSNLLFCSVMLNSDAYSDLIVGNPASSVLLVYLGNGDGSFTFTQEETLSSPIWIEAADLDGDSDEDVIG